MSDRRAQREELGLTQAAAAAKAGLSFATWRRWEEDPDSVRPATRNACERVLGQGRRERAALRLEYERYEENWRDRTELTPRQAMAISVSLDIWADLHLGQWLSDPNYLPFYELPPLDQLDLRVLMQVDGNRSWVESLRRRCVAVAEEVRGGILPFSRPGCFADEVLMAMVVSDARELMNDDAEFFEDVEPRDDPDEDGALDSDWDDVTDRFDRLARWRDWDVPTVEDHPLLRGLLEGRAPSTWFDGIR